MTSVGETLRCERLRRNLSLGRISEELKISPRLLEAIEEERFERLPGGVFTKSFVRQYARFLGLDEDEILSDLQHSLEPQLAGPSFAETRKPEVEISLPRVKEWEAVGDRGFRWSSSLSSLALVLVVMLICSGVYTFWQQRMRRLAAAHESQAVAASKSAVTKPAASAPEPAPQETAPAGAAVTASTGAAGAASEPAGPATPAAVPSEPNPNAAVRVQMTAEEPVWVSAKTDGKISFMGTLESNESRTVEANSNVVLRLGNAGGVNILLNGKAIGPVGPKGQIRTLQLTSGGFHVVPPEPDNPPPTVPAANPHSTVPPEPANPRSPESPSAPTPPADPL